MEREMETEVRTFPRVAFNVNVGIYLYDNLISKRLGKWYGTTRSEALRSGLRFFYYVIVWDHRDQAQQWKREVMGFLALK